MYNKKILKHNIIINDCDFRSQCNHTSDPNIHLNINYFTQLFLKHQTSHFIKYDKISDFIIYYYYHSNVYLTFLLY